MLTSSFITHRCKRNFVYGPLFFFLVTFLSCKNGHQAADAEGTFEADETIISAEASGVLREFAVTEGQELGAGTQVGLVDTVQLILKRRQLEAQIRAMGYRVPDIPVQTGFFAKQKAVAQTRLNYLQHEQARIQNLVKADAATQKQLDDITAQLNEATEQLAVIGRQEAAQVSAFETQTSAIRGDVQPLMIQMEQTDDLLRKCRIINPINGTVLSKYVNANEVVSPGKPLYKIADLSTILLRAYLTTDQLAKVKLNQKVQVKADDGKGGYREYAGVIEWVSNKAEFTPKTIQTKDERANLVYAVKVNVRNDGYLKIGMYGELAIAEK